MFVIVEQKKCANLTLNCSHAKRFSVGVTLSGARNSDRFYGRGCFDDVENSRSFRNSSFIKGQFIQIVFFAS